MFQTKVLEILRRHALEFQNQYVETSNRSAYIVYYVMAIERIKT